MFIEELLQQYILLLDGEFEFIEAKVLEKSDLLNKKIKIVTYQKMSNWSCSQGQTSYNTRGDFVFEKDDLVVLLASRDQLKEIENIFSII